MEMKVMIEICVKDEDKFVKIAKFDNSKDATDFIWILKDIYESNEIIIKSDKTGESITAEKLFGDLLYKVER